MGRGTLQRMVLREAGPAWTERNVHLNYTYVRALQQHVSGKGEVSVFQSSRDCLLHEAHQGGGGISPLMSCINNLMRMVSVTR